MALKSELNRLKEELLNKDKYISKISVDFSNKECDYTNEIQDLHCKIREESTSYLSLLNKYELLEKEFSELVLYF